MIIMVIFKHLQKKTEHVSLLINNDSEISVSDIEWKGKKTEIHLRLKTKKGSILG